MAVQWDAFTIAYIEAALWSSCDGRDDTDRPLDETGLPLSDDAAERMAADCQAFQDLAASILEAVDVDCPTACGGILSTEAQAGHDFWLTRNGHGAGFWDGDWSEPAASQLTELAESFGEVWLYVGDDDEIHIV